MIKEQIRWDDSRYSGEVYAVTRGGATIARISDRNGYFDVFPCPDSPPEFHDEKSGITMDSFRTLGAAKAWIESFLS